MRAQSRIERLIQPQWGKSSSSLAGHWARLGSCGRCLILLAVVALLSSQPGFAQPEPAGQHWVVTWAAAPQPLRTPPPPGSHPDGDLNNRTLRMIVHTSIGGRQVRVQLSNALGAAPLVVGAAHIAIRSTESAVLPNSDRVLLFSGTPSFTIPPGALIVSDPVNLDVLPLSDLSISVYVSGGTSQPTMHFLGLHTTYISKEGDFTSLPAMADVTTSQSWYWLSSVDVLAPASAQAIVAIGDSITDGTRSTLDTNHSWPSILAQRLLSGGAAPSSAVANEGIAGNRILHDSVGPSALARFDRDVLGLSGVTTLIILEGINDIQVATRPANPADPVSTDDVIGGLRQIVERSHLHGISVIGCTLTPYQGAPNYSERGDAMRETVNQWIRTGGAFDAVIDFESAVRDPANPKRFLPAYDGGDHLHPNDAGYKAMADSIDLSLFALASRPRAARAAKRSGRKTP
jgi:lysophospholipase L1-like esterase